MFLVSAGSYTEIGTACCSSTACYGCMVSGNVGRGVVVLNLVRSSVHSSSTAANSGRPSPVHSYIRGVVPVQLCICAPLCMAVDSGYSCTAVP